MNEHDANRALIDAAALHAAQPDPLEQTQRMPVADRRYRQNEAKQQHVDIIVDELAALREYHIEIEGTCPPRVHLFYRDFRDRERPGTVHDRAQQDGFCDE